ncbi:MAG: hypothetical protein JNL38_12200 [Myxococcales bacterium]|jgi:hypothetical protein|nr:hypothetical protein [Myxococcales bacterium]
MTSGTASAVRALGALALAASVSAATCGDGGGGGSAADAGVGPLPPDAASSCPVEAPANGSACALPEGTTCAFGACGGFSRCTLGVWHVAPSVPGVVCPEVRPTPGAACPQCVPAGTVCRYNEACTEGAGVPTSRATCTASGRLVWVLETNTCPEPDGGAATDGGRDGASDASLADAAPE